MNLNKLFIQSVYKSIKIPKIYPEEKGLVYYHNYPEDYACLLTIGAYNELCLYRYDIYRNTVNWTSEEVDLSDPNIKNYVIDAIHSNCIAVSLKFNKGLPVGYGRLDL